MNVQITAIPNVLILQITYLCVPTKLITFAVFLAIIKDVLSRISQFQGHEDYLEQYVNPCCLTANQLVSTQDFVYVLIEGEIENWHTNQLIEQDFKTLAKFSLERRHLQIIEKMNEEQEQHRKIEFFYRYPFFASLSLRQLKYVVSQLEEHQFKYGTLLNRKSLCLIKTGYYLSIIRAVLLRRRNHQIAVIGPGDLFGEYIYLDQDPYDSICYSESVTLFIVDILAFDLDMDETIAYLRSKSALRIKKPNNLKIDLLIDNSKRLKPRIQVINEIEAHSTKANDLQKQYFQNLHTMESKAFLKFQEIFMKMNQSYSRTKNYFQSKKLPTDKLFYQVFMNNATSRSPTKNRYMASNNATSRQLTTSNNGTARRLTMSGTRQTFQKTLTNDERRDAGVLTLNTNIKMSELLPSPNCPEFALNGYHLQGLKNCAICTAPPEPPKIIESDEQMTKYQQEILNNQKKMLLDFADADEDDPDFLLALVEKYGTCECCQGFVFNCNGAICQDFGKCYCYLKDQQDRIDI